MNDPNGMVYYSGEYHLFYQHYPEGMTWGPMHWGHAVSTDLVHWMHRPIALYPDSLGWIFSGSAVVDEDNTSGFGTQGNPPLVAVFTYHSNEKEKAGASDFQYQGIAFSVDRGRTWTKYDKNPVLKNQGVRDFRDPKVFWHEETHKWIMILAVKDHVELWSSTNLKEWNKLSDFGFDYGAHGGVWECPDLFPLKVEGEDLKRWVMIVSINPGGPNGGSATQYFTGDFDGSTFKPDGEKDEIRWIDYGPDNYAGVTWANAPEGRKIFLGWMSNWAYAQEVPTHPWRSAMTVARDLSMKRIGKELHVTSSVAPELLKIAGQPQVFESLTIDDVVNMSDMGDMGVGDVSKSIISGTFEAKNFSLVLSNKSGQNISIGFDSGNNRFFIDRSQSGQTDFSKQYFLEGFAPRILSDAKISMTMIVDVSSVEVLFDEGVQAMTSVFFPEEEFSVLSIRSESSVAAENLSIWQLKSIWLLK